MGDRGFSFDDKWYESKWFKTGLIVVLLIIGGTYWNNQSYYTKAKAEDTKIFSKIEKTGNELFDIESKYSKQDVFFFTDFSESDLEKYSSLLNDQEKNIQEMIYWIPSNEKYLKHIGDSDLIISESIRDLKSDKKTIEEYKIKIGTTRELKELQVKLEEELGDLFLGEEVQDKNVYTVYENSLMEEYEKDIPQDKECDNNVNYLFTEYYEYAKFVSSDLINLAKLEVPENENPEYFFGEYGGREGIENYRNCGKVYFMMFRHGEWDSTRYWAVEIDAETGELLRWEEVTAGNNDFDSSKFWWID